MHVITRVIALAVVVAVSLAHVGDARAFQCRAMRALTVVGLSGSPLPTDARLYVRTRSDVAVQHIRLMDTTTGKRVKVALVNDGWSPLHLKPAKALGSEHTFELFYKKDRVASFRTGKGPAPSDSPDFGKAALKLSKKHFTDTTRPAGKGGYTGRAAQIVVDKTPPKAPAVVEVHVVWAPKKGRAIERRLLVRYEKNMTIASLSPCMHTSTPAPLNGRYTLIASGWSANGFKSQVLTFDGPIR